MANAPLPILERAAEIAGAGSARSVLDVKVALVLEGYGAETVRVQLADLHVQARLYAMLGGARRT